MSRYTKDEQAIFKQLCNQDVADIKLVGNTIQRISFKSSNSALLVDCRNKTAKLFYPIRTPYEKEDRKEFAKLVSLLSLIEEAEKKGQIYLQTTNAGCELFFYENFKGTFLMGGPANFSVKHSITQSENIVYEIDRTNTVEQATQQVPTLNPNILYITKDGNKIMRSTDVTSMYARIEHYLCGRAFPTSALSRFIDNGFCLDEEKRSIKSQKISIASFFVAMLALVISMPCVSVWYSNNHGYSTMDTIQYQQLLNKVDTIKASIVGKGEAKNAVKIKLRN